MLKKSIIACLIISASISACSKDAQDASGRNSQSGGATMDAGTKGALLSAEINPSNPTAKTPLSLSYENRGQDGSLINYTFRWFVDNELVKEGPEPTMEPGAYRKGSQVYVEFVSADGNSKGGVFRTKAVEIGNIPPEISSVSLRPVDPPVEALITAQPDGSDADGGELQYTYQWFVNGKAATERTNINTFSTKGLAKGDLIYTTVIPSDREVSGQLVASEIIKLSNRPPHITSNPTYAVTNGLYAYQVTAKDPDNDRLTYRLDTAPQGMTINATSGLIRWEVPKQTSSRQEVLMKITADDGDGGSAIQEFSFVLNP